MCHILQDVLLVFTSAVWCRPSLALPHTHSSSGRVKSQTNLPDKRHCSIHVYIQTDTFRRVYMANLAIVCIEASIRWRQRLAAYFTEGLVLS